MRLSLLALTFIAFSLSSQAQLISDSVATNMLYADQVFYSLSTGNKTTVSNTQWDLQFVTNLYSVAVRINSGNGVKLYLPTNSDTANFTSTNIDTTGATQLRDGYDKWENSAFTSIATGHPNYGWGEYIGSGNLKGNKVFILQLSDGSFQKVWIKSHSSSGVYDIDFADLNGANLQSISINKAQYLSKTHVYYDVETNTILDLEPLSTDWDLVFRKYEDDLGGGVYYSVNGVLGNQDIGMYEARAVNTDLAKQDWASYSFDSTINIIGHDWKTYTSAWDIEADLSYFVKDNNGDVYQIVFTGFTSGYSGDGESKFTKELMTNTASVQDVSKEIIFNLYPNPSNGLFYVNTFQLESSVYEINIMDLSGKMVHQSLVNAAQANKKIDLTHLNKGVYIMTISNGIVVASERLIIE